MAEQNFIDLVASRLSHCNLCIIIKFICEQFSFPPPFNNLLSPGNIVPPFSSI